MKLLAIPILLIIAIAAVACGTDDGSPASGGGGSNGDIAPPTTQFTLEDFTRIGFKVADEYDVTGLTSAESAAFGFWRPGSSPAKEFEIRFYPSNEIAIADGTAFADEATGENAVLDAEETSWAEGIKDRRYFFAGPVGSHGSGSVQAKYGGYVIAGNAILLCEGQDPGQSRDLCEDLIEEVQEARGA